MLDQIVEMLKSKKLKVTSIRHDVLQHFIKKNAPISHTDLYAHFTKVDRATIYRTLQNLSKAKILHKVIGVDGISRYALNDQNDKCGGNHIHFMCMECKQITCMPSQKIEWIEAPEGYQIVSKQFIISGVCKSCLNK